MRYVMPASIMMMAILMIVCTREESIKYGTIIFAVCLLWLFILTKMKKPNKALNQEQELAHG